MSTHWHTLGAMVAVLGMLTGACASDPGQAADQEAPALEVGADGAVATPADGELAGPVNIDGSSTVAPLTDAIAEEYFEVAPAVSVNTGVSGTGGGFERFCGTGDIDIANASRAISDEEIALCDENGVEFVEVRVGTDALSMVVHPDNDWLTCLNNEQIAQIWGPDRAPRWSDIDPSWPDEEIDIFAPASTSGTYDFFNETVGVEDPTQDYSATENDNDIVRGVRGTRGGWGYFGFAFLEENADALKALAYDAGEGCVEPTAENAVNGTYGLTRPLFIYIRSDALAKPQVRDFTQFYLDEVDTVIEQVGYIPADAATLEESRQDLQQAIEAAT